MLDNPFTLSDTVGITFQINKSVLYILERGWSPHVQLHVRRNKEGLCELIVRSTEAGRRADEEALLA